MSTTTPASDDNPLLHVHNPVPFDRIRAEHVEPALALLLRDAQAQLDAIGAIPAAERSYHNTLGALERATEALEYAMGVVGHLESVATTPALRAAYNAAQPLVSAFYAALPLNQGLWRGLNELAEHPAAQGLSPAQARLLKKTLADFRRHGALLDEAGKQRLRAIDVELAQVTTQFSQQLLDATNAFELHLTDEAQVQGLPESARSLAREAAAQRGLPGYRLTLHQPSLGPALTYLDDAGLREILWRASNRRAIASDKNGLPADSDNPALIRRILALRAEKARLLGFRDFADLILHDRMAHDGATALAFLSDLRERTAAAFAREAQELAAYRRELEGPDAPPLQPWDLAYYAEKQRLARHDFDDEVLRPYLSAEGVLGGLFDLAQRLYGVRIAESPMTTWDPAVRCYAIHDGAAEGGEPLSRFYVDLHPRENKRGGAWMNGLLTGTPEGLSGRTHLGLFCANVQPPLPSQGLPSLLTHDEVETLFHEFGHLLHHALTKVTVRSLAGTNVPWDFVELPSQFMENFCWEREALDRFARHHHSGEPIPQELLTRLLGARTYRAASAQMRQLGFAAVDLLLHTSYDPERDGPVLPYARGVLAAYTPAELPDDYGMLAGFGHLFGSAVGYAAGYYSYKWAEVLDADAFGRFKEEGLFDAQVGRAFKEEILEVGDSRDPLESFLAFRGRAPQQEALLRRAGLLEPTAGR